MVNQIWERYDIATIDLFALHKDMLCPLFFAIAGYAPLGLDALALLFSSSMLDTPHPEQSDGTLIIPNLGSPSMAREALVSRDQSSALRQSLATTITN